MPKRQAPHGKHKKGGGGKPKTTAKNKAKSLVSKGKQLLGGGGGGGSVDTQFVENVGIELSRSPAASTPTQLARSPRSVTSNYPTTFYDDDLSIKKPAPLAVASAEVDRRLAARRRTPSTSSTRSSVIGRLMRDGPRSDDDSDFEDEGYHADYRDDMGDEFFAAASGDDVEDGSRPRPLDPIPADRYDGIVYVTDGSASPSSSCSSSSSSVAREDDDDHEPRARQATLGNSSTSWDDTSPATSASKVLHSPPPARTSQLGPSGVTEYRYAHVSSSFAYTEGDYEHAHPGASSSSAHHAASSFPHYYHHFHPSHHHDPAHSDDDYPHAFDPYDSFPSHLVHAYTQSAVPSPAVSRAHSSSSLSSSGASTPRGRNPHPRLLWRSVLSDEVIAALDDHHRRIAGCPLPRIVADPSTSTSSPDGPRSQLAIGEEREGTGKLDVEVRERDKERERSRMGHARRPLSREGRRWSRAVERWGL
ncbi:hypothetical protein JCM10212_004881 [Sporobolomyces blumeae]